MKRAPMQWTGTLDQLLRDEYLRKGPAALAGQLQCEAHQVRHRARHLGLSKRPTYRLWTPLERDLVERLWLTHSVAYIARRLERTPAQVRNAAANMGLPKRVHPWTTREERVLLRDYGARTAVQVGCVLGRGADAVRRRAMLLRRRGGDAGGAMAMGP